MSIINSKYQSGFDPMNNHYNDKPITIKGITKTRAEWQAILDAKSVKTYNQFGCIEWKGRKQSKGYGELLLGGRKNPVTIKTHRIVMAIRQGYDDTSRLACHHCDNPSCISPFHLYYGTSSDNQTDAVARCRVNGKGGISDPLLRGSHRYNARLNENQVRQIKILLSQGKSRKVIAKIYNVSESCIGSIANGSNWKHVSL